jgi:Core-2/I-Branching enzyme
MSWSFNWALQSYTMSAMRIAYLILCHDDAGHIGRLARRLVFATSKNSIFIHVDRKSKVYDEVIRSVIQVPNVFVIEERYEVFWGGFSAINATYALLRAAVNNGGFDRYVLLQGADYPIKSNQYIDLFFADHKDVEYMRAVNCAASKNNYFHSKARHSIYLDRPSLLKQIRNKLVRILDLKIKPRDFAVNGKTYNVYWGCAQFAVTHKCVELILQYEKCHELRNHFGDIFPADETFFHTVVYNSDLVSNTTHARPEGERELYNLIDLMNLTYFEYPELVTIFTKDDFRKIIDLPHLYVRKVRTTESSELLDMIDRHSGAADLIYTLTCSRPAAPSIAAPSL